MLGRRLIVTNKAQPLTIKRIKPDTSARVAYLVKEPYSGKSLNPLTNRYERTIEDMRGPICLRLTEIHSHIGVNEVLFSSGCCRIIRAELLDALECHKEQNGFPRRGRFQSTVGDFWEHLRAADAAPLSPVQILRKGGIK